MRAATTVLVSAFLALTVSADVTQVTVSPEPGQPPELENPPSMVRVLFPGASFDPEVRLLDHEGREVPADVESGGSSEWRYFPETQPLPDGQYTVEFPTLDVVKTFTVGPDVYSPMVLATGEKVLARHSALSLLFNEPIDTTTVTKHTVSVWDVSGDEPSRVNGKLRVDSGGTRIVFNPVGWPGFEPRGEFEVRIAEDVTDLHGNSMTELPPRFAGETEETREGPARVPESVYWTNRRSLGVLDLKPAEGGIGMEQHTIGDPIEAVINPRVSVMGDGMVYGLNPRRGGSVAVVNARSGSAMQHAPVRAPTGIAVHPSGELLYVSSRTRGTVTSFETKGTLRVRAQIEVGGRAGGVAVSPSGGTVACVSKREAHVALLDAVTLEPIDVIPTDRRPEDVTFVRQGDWTLLLVTCRGKRARDGSVLAIDLFTGDLVARFDGIRRPARIVGRDGRAWVAEEGADRVVEIVLPAGSAPVLGRRIPAGRKPVDVATSPDGSGRLFVVNRRRGRLTVVSTEPPGIVAELRAPGALAVASWGED